jgi:predicted transcriptional regulator
MVEISMIWRQEAYAIKRMLAEQAEGTVMKDQVTEIVAAYVRKNAIATDQLPALITTVAQSLAGLG